MYQKKWFFLFQFIQNTFIKIFNSTVVVHELCSTGAFRDSGAGAGTGAGLGNF